MLPALSPALKQPSATSIQRRTAKASRLGCAPAPAIGAPILLSAAEMSRTEGTPDGFVWVFHDITERKERSSRSTTWRTTTR